MMSRRYFCRGVVAGLCIGMSSYGLVSLAEPEVTGNAKSADEWMQHWMDKIRKEIQQGGRDPVGAMLLGRFADPVYYLYKPIGWHAGAGQGNHPAISVPVGFVTDFASIPRPFWSLLRPDGEYAYAAVIHDYLYWEQPVKREEADEIFRLCMEDFRIDKPVISAIHKAVRAGGGSAWKENARLKQVGEKRLLAKFPDDPTIRWQEWKKNPDVFRPDRNPVLPKPE